MPGITGGNSLDFMVGCRARMEYGPWVTAAGGATFLEGGWLEGISVEESREYKDVEADNCTYPLAAFPIKSSLVVKGNFIEASLRKKEVALGGVPANVVVASGVATRPIKEAGAVAYWQVRLTVADQSMKPAHTEFPTDVYIKRTATFWRGRFEAKVSQSFKRDDKVVTPFEIHFYYDTTVTESTVLGAIGKEIDSTT